MARYDAGRLNNKSTRSARIYKDLNLDFQQNTATKDIQKLLDVESVKRSVRNLINLNHYEKPFPTDLTVVCATANHRVILTMQVRREEE